MRLSSAAALQSDREQYLSEVLVLCCNCILYIPAIATVLYIGHRLFLVKKKKIDDINFDATALTFGMHCDRKNVFAAGAIFILQR
jgi:hypothetical protein